ncbi:Cro/Cl family transcriptional regulator [Canicola haemoglobinophilus]|uniref:Transcriptional regulator n=1 Tax=Canicola haemoglobinophilus TaxID=733 RepID=A0A1V4AYJ2_9PAST|nr:helix-turn-helix transcriptional regulator [Canicola haemoglobinophilus]OOR97094.1 Cro/Cl family transcriptional regulator [Canicola haemoglobinophilus]STO60753.1 transcriptional regulator [Canicola haemoglobinophilus]
MKNSKEWWSVSELLDKELETLPKTDKGISKKADRENWEKRQRSGVKGKTFEYHYSSFPEDVQRALGFSSSPPSKQTTQQKAFSEVRDVAQEEQVPFYSATASAGFGAVNSDIYAPEDYIGLSKRWIDSRGLYRNSLAFIMAEGDSMYPTINDGDMLLINRNATTPRDGKIYVLRSGEQFWVKRVQGIINGIRLISDNKAIYDPIDVAFNEGLDFEVVGQVVFIGRDMI